MWAFVSSRPARRSPVHRVVDSACYRELELDDVRTWYPGESAAVRLTGSTLAEVVIRSKDPEYVVVSLENGEPKIVAEFEQPSPGGFDRVWPPIPVDIDGDGLEEAVFPTVYAEVHILSYESDIGEYAFLTDDEFLPLGVFQLLGALDADVDGEPELVACTGTSSDPTDTYMTIVDRVDGGWTQVGEPLFVPEVSSGILVTKPLVPDSGNQARLGYINFDENGRGMGVTIVRVDEGFDLVKEASFDSEFEVTDFTSGDFDGNGFTDIYIGVYDTDDDEELYLNHVYFFDGAEWSGPKSYELGQSGFTWAGDMTGDGAADLLVLSEPLRALDVVGDRKLDLIDANRYLTLKDLNGDGLADITHRPPVEPFYSNEPTVLRFLVSFQ